MWRFYGNEDAIFLGGWQVYNVKRVGDNEQYRIKLCHNSRLKPAIESL